ncbi:MAG: LptF/LptG family permease [Nitrospirota bacterium]|nr:LptF/LptG family permease [Nitrospirota bacterium]MDH5768824.1 LptF/LptG family permease [Nitrospirota bacterium]
MLIIQRHYLKEFFKLLALIGIGLASIFSILDLIDKIDDFMPSRPDLKSLLLYAIFNFPKYLLYLLPAAMLLCSLFIFSQASRNKEVVAIKATGGKLKTLLYPFIIAGILLSIFAFVVGESIVPDFSRRSNELKNTLMKKEKKLLFKDGTLWLRGTDGSPVRIELYIPEKRLVRGLSIFVFGKDFLEKRIEAEVAEWIEVPSSKFQVPSSENIWRLKNVTIYDIESGKVNKIPKMDYQYLESPDFFSEGIKKPEEMGIGELYGYTNRLKTAGFRNTKLVVDLNSKISYPLTNFFMIILGISLSMKGLVGRGLFVAGLGLFISIIYWFTYTFTLSMGYAGILPPVISTWLVPVLFGTVAGYLFSKIPE